MSLIATFWTFKKEGLADLLEKTKPYEKEITKESWFKKAKTESVYPWFDYLNESAHQEAECDFSGMAMTDFDLILMNSSSSVFDCGLSESNLISEYSGGSAVLISYDAATKIIKNIAALNLSEADVVKFYDEDEKPEDWRCNPHDVVKSGNIIKSWCEKVTPEKLGLLVIG